VAATRNMWRRGAKMRHGGKRKAAEWLVVKQTGNHCGVAAANVMIWASAILSEAAQQTRDVAYSERPRVWHQSNAKADAIGESEWRLCSEAAAASPATTIS